MTERADIGKALLQREAAYYSRKAREAYDRAKASGFAVSYLTAQCVALQVRAARWHAHAMAGQIG